MSLTDPTLRHLYVELARLDLLIHRRVARLERSMQQRAAALGGDRLPTVSHLTTGDVQRLLQQPFGESYAAEGDAAEPDLYADALEQVQQQIADVVQEALEDEDGSRLVQLAIACELSRYELDAFLVCLAPALDLRYERIYGFLHDDLTRRRATPNLILDLLSAPGPERLADLVHLSEHAPLLRYHVVEQVAEPGILQPVLLNQALAPEPSVVLWLLGRYRPGPALEPFTLYDPEPTVDQAQFTAEQQAAMMRALEQTVSALDDGEEGEDEEGEDEEWEDEEDVEQEAADRTAQSPAAAAAFLLLTGKDAAAQQSAMRWLAAALGAPLLRLDLQAAVRAGADPEETVKIFLRDARLTNALAALSGWDALLEDAAPPARVLEALFAHPGPVVIGAESVWRPRDIDRERRLTWLHFPPPTYVQRREYLAAAVAGLASDEPLDAAAIAGRFVLTTRQMADMVASALDHAAQAGRPLRNEDLFAAAREHSSPRLSTMARKLSARYDWDDLVLPDDQITRLRELVLMVRGRAQVLDEWGYARKLAPSYGISALFAGAPGTGKTMAAEVLAKQLGLDLYKIDLSGLISKYIGETEKNLERIFTEAENSNAILFFDEADAVFGKRSEVKDAHDRYANIETSYLLQRMEAYDGVTILATNLRANLDEAFTRRLHGVIDFPFPDAAQRLRIWEALFPATTPRTPDVDLTSLARRFKIAGGSIRNVIVAAAYFAAADGGAVTMAHLLHATRRELQKLGRLTDERDFAA